MSFFTEKLKFLRKEKRLTQKEIAQQIGIKQNSYSDWETGKNEPNLENIVKLSNILDTTTDELLGQTKFALIDYIPLRDIDVSKISDFSQKELDTFKHSIWIQSIQERKTLYELKIKLEEQYHLKEKQKEILDTIIFELENYINS